MRTVALVFAYCLGLAVAAAGLRVVALRNPSESGGMLEHLAERGGDYDLIVIGPSFVRQHFVPPVFEKELRHKGHKLRAFGFGLKGMRGGELDYYLERILDLNLPNLKWVVCDVSLDQLRPLEDRNSYKRRVVQWHGPQQFLFMERAIMAGEGTLRERLTFVSRHARHALLNLGNVGEGVMALRTGSWWSDPERARSRASFHAKPWSSRRLEKAIDKYMKGKGKKRHKKATKKLAERRGQDHRRPRENDMMLAWRDRIRAHGLQPAFLLSPVLSDVRIATEVPGDEPLRVFDFNDPRAYPELYAPDLRYNPSHFHYVGAERFSVAFAGAFAAFLDSEAGKAAPQGHASRPEAERD